MASFEKATLKICEGKIPAKTPVKNFLTGVFAGIFHLQIFSAVFSDFPRPDSKPLGSLSSIMFIVFPARSGCFASKRSRIFLYIFAACTPPHPTKRKSSATSSIFLPRQCYRQKTFAKKKRQTNGKLTIGQTIRRVDGDGVGMPIDRGRRHGVHLHTHTRGQG